MLKRLGIVQLLKIYIGTTVALKKKLVKIFFNII